MRDTKRRIEAFSFYDHTGIEAHLEKMAAKGWLLERMTGFGWVYRRIEPGRVKFTVTYYPRASEFDPEPSEQQKTFYDFCQHSGWEIAASLGQMQVFYNERENPVPIDTDAVLEVENIHNSARRGYLPAYFVLLAIAFFQGFLVVQRFRQDAVGLLVETSNLFTIFCWLILCVLCLAELSGYFRWHRKARRAAEQGIFMDTWGHGRLAVFLLAALLAATVYWLFSLGEDYERMIGLFSMFSIFLLILLVNVIKLLLKKKRVSAGINRTITIVSCIVLSIAMTGGLTALAITGVKNGFFEKLEKKAPEVYAYKGVTFSVYHHELPLRVEDLRDSDYGEYSTFWKARESSPFLAQYEAAQRPRMDALEEPALEYTVTKVKIPLLSDWCFRQIFRKYDRYTKEQPEEYREHYVETDAALWGADASYRMYYGETPRNQYLVCWENRIAELNADWELTPEQMMLAGEKLREI